MSSLVHFGAICADNIFNFPEAPPFFRPKSTWIFGIRFGHRLVAIPLTGPEYNANGGAFKTEGFTQLIM